MTRSNDCGGNGTEGVEFNVVGLNSGYTDSEVSTVPVSPGFGIAIISGLPADTYREAVLHCREMRNRYTFLDIAADAGILEDFAAGEA